MSGSTREARPDPALVSIVTPAHNAERFLAETIRSVQAQTYAHWEMWIVDDLSTDRTSTIVAEFAAADHRIRRLGLDKNHGPAAARNAGMDAARGRFVAFLDADDLWLPEKLARQLAFAEQTGAPFTFTSYHMIDEQGRALGRSVRVPESIDYRGLLKNTTIGCLTVMLDRERLGSARMPALRKHEDLALWFELLKRGLVARGLQEDLARYRIVRGSRSRDKLATATHMWSVYREVEKLSLLDSLWCYTHYAWRASRRHWGY
jgi:teichuronic acid biosynthesis glycosyltransferase TuaG